MRKHLLALLAATFLAPAAYAADSANVQVLANVVGTCKFISAPDVNFGTLDPSVGTDVSADTNVSFWCTKGVNYSLTVGNGANFDTTNSMRRMKATDGSDFIQYALTPVSATGTGTGRGTPVNLRMTAQIQGSDYVNASVGAYADTVQLTVTP